MKFLLPVATLWWREIVRFARQRSRWMGAFAQPLVFWLLLGGGMNHSFQPTAGVGGQTYVEYFFPGVVVMVLLFTAIFATISTVEDRNRGFLQGVLVAPVSRQQIVLGQALGGTTLACLQGVLFLLLAPFAGIPLRAAGFVPAIAVILWIAFLLTNLGLLIAWRMESTQGFHAIMNLILLPIWFLSGAFFPASGAPGWLQAVMTVNPLTYGLALLRRTLYWQTPEAVAALPDVSTSIAVLGIASVLVFVSASTIARRAEA
ncbi:MAG: ABC transporter permease [Candidatus Binatia bacterium]